MSPELVLPPIRAPSAPQIWAETIRYMLDELNTLPGVKAYATIEIDTYQLSPHNAARIRDTLAGLPFCRECGCTDNSACPGGCSWTEPDLCSACAKGD